MSAAPTPLQSHPVAPAPWVEALTVTWDRSPQGLAITYTLSGDVSRLVWPTGEGGHRRDELWKTTCFEAFFRAPDSDHYAEFNFAPNGDWAAYQFTGYRADPSNLTCTPPLIESRMDKDTAILHVRLASILPDQNESRLLFGPTAILEDGDGTHSYWALHHALIKPDFHHTDTFKITLD